MKFPHYEPTQEQLDALPPESRAMWEDVARRKAEQEKLIDDLAAERKFGEALVFVGSESRAEKLVDWDEQYHYTDEEARQLVTDFWSVTEAWSGDQRLRDGMFNLLKRVAPIHVTTDPEYGDVRPLNYSATHTVYRGNLGETPGAYMSSWTLDPKVGELFANMSAGPRGWFLGMARTDGEEGVPTVWQGTVDAADILGYFDDRSEQEVVIDGGKVRDIRILAQAGSKQKPGRFGVGAGTAGGAS
jgi:hypothetical protein